MELTRLRRLLREYEGHGYDDLRALVDACDRFREELEAQEDVLKSGVPLYPEILGGTVEEQSKALVATILSIPGMAPRIWNVLVDQMGAEWVQRRMENTKSTQDEPLGDLLEHPF